MDEALDRIMAVLSGNFTDDAVRAALRCAYIEGRISEVEVRIETLKRILEENA